MAGAPYSSFFMAQASRLGFGLPFPDKSPNRGRLKRHLKGLRRFPNRPYRFVVVAAWIVIASIIAAACEGAPWKPETSNPMKIGLLLNFTGSPEASADRKRAFDLAILQINEGGGVLGRPVESITADATSDPLVAVEEARRLVEDEGVHAIVGPNASSAALPVAEAVSGPAGIPTISPSATSPELTEVADDGYFFRTALSDTVQGPILARVARERGFDNVGLIYHDDAYGRGLAASFEASWDGTVRAVAVEPTRRPTCPSCGRARARGAGHWCYYRLRESGPDHHS